MKKINTFISALMFTLIPLLLLINSIAAIVGAGYLCNIFFSWPIWVGSLVFTTFFFGCLIAFFILLVRE